MCRPPRIPANLSERTMERAATFAGCAKLNFGKELEAFERTRLVAQDSMVRFIPNTRLRAKPTAAAPERITRARDDGSGTAVNCKRIV